jgi:hypothetical protein
MSNETSTQYDLESRWITAGGIPGVNYHYGDIVRIKTGEHAAETAEVIALLDVDPEPKYGIVLPPNEKFVVMSQNDLESTGSNSGGKLIMVKPGEPSKTSTRR